MQNDRLKNTHNWEANNISYDRLNARDTGLIGETAKSQAVEDLRSESSRERSSWISRRNNNWFDY